MISAPSFSQDVKDIWKQLGPDIDGEAAADASGWSVSMSSDGTIVAIGAHNNNNVNGNHAGHVRVYQYASSTDTWTQLGPDIDGEAADDGSGYSVSLSDDGTILAIGAYNNNGNGNNAGHVRVYQYASSTDTWTQLGPDIDGEGAGDYSGYSVSLSSDGTIVSIGSPYNNGNGDAAGHVRVYQYASGSWTQLGSDIDGEAANDQSGYSVSLSSDGTIVSIGATGNDRNGNNAGHVRVYQYASGSWTQLGSDIDGEGADDSSGYSVSLSDDGTIIAIGADRNNGNGNDAGHVRVYKYVSSNWSQVGSDINGEAATDRSGRSVSLSSDGTIVAIGAHQNDGNGNDAGHVRVYKNVSDVWTKICTCGPDGGDIDGEAAFDYSARSSLSSDGTKLAIGAYLNNNGNGSDAGHVRVYEAVDLTVTLSVSNSTIAESAGAVTVTATLNNAAASCEVTVDLSFSGTATGGGTDYRMSSNSITISAGSKTGTTTLTVVDDAIDENDETVIIDISSVINATESGTQRATVTITDNDIPTALDVSETTSEDTPVDITLVGSGAGSLTYSIDATPANGTVTLSGATATYTPDLDYNGSDSFTYKVSTEVTDSNVATASITVTPVNDAPVTSTLEETTNEDTPVDIDIVATDVENDVLTYVITTRPTNGGLAMTGSVVTYTPNLNYNGSDSFKYRVNDGTLNSNATVPITVNPINDPPVSSDKTETTNEDVSLPIDITATDVEGDGSINYTIVSNPTNGSVSIAGNIATYTPKDNYNGTDSFTYKANDGTDDGNTATVSITITAVDDVSVAQPQSITTKEDTPKSFNLLATVPDGDVLTYGIASAPANGTVTLSGATATYTPDLDYNGSDSFQFSVNDGTTTTIATVSITVTPVDDISVAKDQDVSTNEDTPVGINLNATNVDGDVLTYSILTNPTNGILILVGSTVTYTPNANYHGPDSFTWSVNDGTTTTSAIVIITVRPINDPPVADNLVATTSEDTPVNVTLVANDIEEDPITYDDPARGIGVIGNPKNGRVSLSGTTLTYTPNADYNGVDLLTYKVAHVDCSGIICDLHWSNTANISITVLPINDAPVAFDIDTTTNEDTPVDITLLVTDVDADEINYNILTLTTNGMITISGNVVTYTPNPDYFGPDSFTYNGANANSTLSLGGADGTFEALAPVASTSLLNGNVTGGGWLNGSNTADSWLSPLGFGTSSGYAAGMPSSPDGGVFAGIWANSDGSWPESFYTIVDLLQIGTQYTVTFYQANAGMNSSNVNEVDDIQVIFGPDTLNSPNIPFLGYGSQVWSEVSLVFTATATSQRLEFYNMLDAGIYSYMVIDGITITTPNPNPLISNTATVTINVLPINDPPIVVKDTFYVNEQDILIVTLLDPNLIINNDIDVDNPLADLSAVIHIPPQHNLGVFTLGTKGEFIYTHDCNDSDNEDYIIYYVNDGDLNSLISDTVIIYILNEAPFGEPDFYSVQNSQILNIDAASGPILNDVDSNSCDVLSVILVQPPTQHVGTFVLDSNGAFNYIHDGTVISDQDYFVYQLNDGEDNAVETDTVYISIVNPPPTAVAHYYAVDEGKQLVVDSTQGLLIGAVSPLGFEMKAYIDQPPSNGVLLPAGDINTNGSFVYEHDCSDTPGEDFFTFTVVDSAGRSDPPDTVYITINNVCPNGNNDEYTVTEGETIDISLDFGVLVNDLDDNPCDPLSVNLVTPPLYHNGGFVLNSDGSFIYSHDDSENFEDQFSYRLSDGECMGAVYTVTIIVDPVDDKPPIANNDLIPTCVDEGGSFTIATYAEGVLGNDIDPDVKDSILTAILVDPPMYGDLIFNSDGTFTYTHDGGDEISDAFTYICNDGDFNSLDTATVSICINPINDCPVAEDDIFLINEGDILDSSVVFNDSDPDTFEEDFLITTVVTPPAIGILELKSDGTFKYFSPSQVPLPGPEIVTFVYKLSDGTCEVTANVTITINSINDCPIAEDDTITVNALDYDTIIKDLIMNDHDIDSPLDSTSIEIINPPHWGDYIVNGDGTISYIYTGSPTKKDSLTYWVRDSEGCYSNEATLLIYIENIQFPEYQLPDYFTPNADRFNDYFVIKLKNITLENVKFEVLILDRYQRKVFESTITGDEIWDGMNQFTGGTVKKDFYYYQITPIEYGDTKARTIVGVLLLDR